MWNRDAGAAAQLRLDAGAAGRAAGHESAGLRGAVPVDGWADSFLRQSARTRIPGLYCAGGSTHPGAGVPMAALSGRLAAATVLKDLGSTRLSLPAAMRGGMSMPSPTAVPSG